MTAQKNIDPLKKHQLSKIDRERRPLSGFIWSMGAVIPSILIGWFLKDTPVPVQYAYFVGCTILLLAAFNFATVIFIEQYRDSFGKTTIPALIGADAVIFMYIIAESFNRFLSHIGYNYIGPFVLLAVIIIYVAIFNEKRLSLKIYLSLNSMSLLLLWAMGAAEKITMPF